MAAQITAEEREMMRDVYRYLAQHIDPPPNGTDAAISWWQAAIRDASALGCKWSNHPLITEVMLGILSYLEQKGHNADN